MRAIRETKCSEQMAEIEPNDLLPFQDLDMYGRMHMAS